MKRVHLAKSKPGLILVIGCYDGFFYPKENTTMVPGEATCKSCLRAFEAAAKRISKRLKEAS